MLHANTEIKEFEWYVSDHLFRQYNHDKRQFEQESLSKEMLNCYLRWLYTNGLICNYRWPGNHKCRQSQKRISKEFELNNYTFCYVYMLYPSSGIISCCCWFCRLQVNLIISSIWCLKFAFKCLSLPYRSQISTF